MNEKELAMQKRITELLIRRYGTPLTMYRMSTASDGQGGVLTAAARTPVADELANPIRRFFGGVTYHHLGFNQPTTIGEQRRFGKVLVGGFEDTFEEGDEFLFEGNWYRVGDIIVDTTYERKAECEWLRSGS